MHDIRLDFINNIRHEMIEAMTVIRKMYIELDSELQCVDDVVCDDENKQAALRCVSIARTHLETSLQYAIKSLCLVGEIKND